MTGGTTVVVVDSATVVVVEVEVVVLVAVALVLGLLAEGGVLAVEQAASPTATAPRTEAAAKAAATRRSRQSVLIDPPAQWSSAS